jgi:hypothetical protein
VKEELGYKPSIERPLSWLVIEDFRTTGLEGDPIVFCPVRGFESVFIRVHP